MEAAKKKLRDLLENLFQFDCADLDFGVYRILNLRRDEFRRFLNDDLLPQVEHELRGIAGTDRAALERQLQEIEASVRSMGIGDPTTVPKWKEIRAQLDAAPDVKALAKEVFSDLATFFSRYYDEGDFMARPRYNERLYAIPYDGSEVKLHWANADQYYIKTSEHFFNFDALVGNRHVRFVLADAAVDRDNNKSNEKRRFSLRTEKPVVVEGDTLTASFVYAVQPDAGRQDAMNAEAERRILAAVPDDWRALLSRPASDDRTELAVLIARYTRRNTADYFIHRDLGAFLRRELDFYIKNEVIHLDDVEGKKGVEFEFTLRRVQAMRAVAKKVIAWLAQIEDYQRRLFLKKKLVLDTSWIVSIDQVPDEFYADIAANEAQIADWQAALGIRDVPKDLVNGSGGRGKTVDVTFLKANKFLPVATRHFPAAWTARLLAALGSSVVARASLLVQGDNDAALRLLTAGHRAGVSLIAIDPPYNTGGDGFLYKDGYAHSSWLAMVMQRVVAARPLLKDVGAMSVFLDDREQSRLREAMERGWQGTFVANVLWQKKYAPANDALWFSDDHDFVMWFATSDEWRPLDLLRTDEQNAAYKNPDEDARGPWKAGDYKSNKSRWERPNSWYAVENPVTGDKVWPPETSVWRFSPEQHATNLKEKRVWWGKEGTNTVPSFKRFLSEVGGVRPRTIWTHDEVGHNQDGVRVLQGMFGVNPFPSPKPVGVLERIIQVGAASSGVVLDFFGGSGTTGHAVISLNRSAGATRRFILVEMGDHFDTVLVPRILKAGYSEEWKEGKPLDRKGVSAVYKVIRLESYDDTLENVEMRGDPRRNALFGASPSLREDYILRYQLDLESKGSLLDLGRFRTPFDYRIKVRRAGVVRDEPVDLVETFNYLLGLQVTHYGILGKEPLEARWVEGTLGKDGREKALVIWRDCEKVSDEELNKRFARADFRLSDFDVIFVNGDNRLENERRGGDHWKVVLIEDEFHARMFAEEA